jgi:pSer/pThr/pTyr-binding forkhead associated (FHA) protein
MGITVIVRSAGPEKTRLTFDGTQRVVIGRGPGSDVRLPDTSVSHRHATLRAHGAEFLLVDEGSTNGTFVGEVRIAPNTSRLVRSGDAVRVGRIWLELRMERRPVTRDLAVATRDLALALVAEAIEAAGADTTTRIRVVEGIDQESVLVLAQLGREYLIGRAPDADLRLNDPDVSREHVRVVRSGDGVVVVDTDAKNGTSLGAARVNPRQPTVWRPAQLLHIGRTVLSLQEPLSDALARIEGSADERLASGEAERFSEAPATAELRARSDSATPGRGGPSSEDSPAGPQSDPPPSAGAASDIEPAQVIAEGGDSASGARSQSGEPATIRDRKEGRWTAVDVAVMTAAIGVLAMSLAGLVWLLRG